MSMLGFDSSEFVQPITEIDMRPLILLVTVVFVMTADRTASGVEFVDPYATDSPCGPNGSNRLWAKLIPQGWRGADFRPACRVHDVCYTTSATDRKQCDAEFGKSLEASCANSRRPRMCRFVARVMARSVDRYGARAYRQGQQIAVGLGR